jgi:hypothetical protein
MITLSYGYKKPEAGDRGSIFFPAMEENIQRLNDHSHNGVDSAPLAAASVAGATVQALAANWGVAIIPGKYKQTVTCPPGYNMNTFHYQVKDNFSGDQIFPTIERVTTTSFDIYTCDNTLTYDILFR